MGEGRFRVPSSPSYYRTFPWQPCWGLLLALQAPWEPLHGRMGATLGGLAAVPPHPPPGGVCFFSPLGICGHRSRRRALLTAPSQPALRCRHPAPRPPWGLVRKRLHSLRNPVCFGSRLPQQDRLPWRGDQLLISTNYCLGNLRNKAQWPSRPLAGNEVAPVGSEHQRKLKRSPCCADIHGISCPFLLGDLGPFSPTEWVSGGSEEVGRCHTGPGALGGGSWPPASCPARCSSREDCPENGCITRTQGGRWPLVEVAHRAAEKAGSPGPELRSFHSLPCACSELGWAHRWYERRGATLKEPTAWGRLGCWGPGCKMGPRTCGRKDGRGAGRLPAQHGTAQSRQLFDCRSAPGSQERAVSHSDTLAPPPKGPGSWDQPPISQVGKLSSKDVPESHGAWWKAGDTGRRGPGCRCLCGWGRTCR